jgi:hypothetical protein
MDLLSDALSGEIDNHISETEMGMLAVVDPKERDGLSSGRASIEQVVMNKISAAVEIVFCIAVQVPVEDRVQPLLDRFLRPSENQRA